MDSRQDNLDVDPKEILQIKFVGQLKKLDNNGHTTDADNDRLIFILMILEKNQRNTTKILSREFNGFLKDGKLFRSKI